MFYTEEEVEVVYSAAVDVFGKTMQYQVRPYAVISISCPAYGPIWVGEVPLPTGLTTKTATEHLQSLLKTLLDTLSKKCFTNSETALDINIVNSITLDIDSIII
jgi:hypothetical protein